MSAALRDRIQNRLNEARKERDRFRVAVLSTVLSDLHNREIEVGEGANDEMVREVVARAIKQRREAADQMRAGGREELASKEEREAELLAEFLPPPLDEEEVRELVREILSDGVTDVGPLMGRLMPRIKGRFDGREANRIAREELAG